MNSPLVPDWVRDSFGSLSPVVLMTLISTSWPRAASWSRTQPACQRASLLPRVPIIILMEPDLGFRIQDLGFRILDRKLLRSPANMRPTSVARSITDLFSALR